MHETPDEMYFGRGDQVPADLVSSRARAREARMKSNRELSCEACRPPVPRDARYFGFLCTFQRVANARRKVSYVQIRSWEPNFVLDGNVGLHGFGIDSLVCTVVSPCPPL